MEIFKVNDLKDYPKLDANSCVIGNFDGLHFGHQALIEKTKVSGLKTLVITFSGLTKPKGIISDTAQREALFQKLAVDYLIILEYEKIKTCFYDEFLKFLKKLKVEMVTCGADFRFGYKGEGDLIDLKNKFKVNVVDYSLYQDKKISTSLIKEFLAQGRLEEVNELLTRPYEVKGIVTHGQKLGRTLGYPTANVDYGDFYLPKPGVYYVKFFVHDNLYDGMANVGHNPTLNLQEKLRLEVNILDFDEEIYDYEVKVIFLKRLRDEEKYPSKEALIESLRKTVLYIKEIR